ncbi:hypothetical protein GCM10010191_44370 [Actinomadura vinacea]|uniref:CobQ/CobB/MinD/ParA nucleotide binding domain-containing protein n=1 Tax=Actinomadura vinacea TaxID=115336 RepID=A0ABN3JCA0_9ACTN
MRPPDQSWQSAVLSELGMFQTGLVVPRGSAVSGPVDDGSGMAPIHDAPPHQMATSRQPPLESTHPAGPEEPLVPVAPQQSARPATESGQAPAFPVQPPAPPSQWPVDPVPASDVPSPPEPGAFEIPLVGFPAELLDDPAPLGPDPSAGHQPRQARPPETGAPASPSAGPPRLEAADLVARNRHGDPMARRVGRGIRHVVGAGAQDLRLQGEAADLLGRRVPGHRQIAVVSVRGGAGKTTMAALLATALARHRADRVLAVDADADLGSLPLRLGVRSEHCLFDLAERRPEGFEEAARYLARTEDGVWVLPATRGGRIAGEFTLETFQAALGSVNRYFAAAVVDCGAGILTELHGGILATTHSQVLVTSATVDGALSAQGALEWFTNSGQGALLARTVIAMVSHAPHADADIDRAVRMLKEGGMHVVLVPYDRHLAMGGTLEPDKLGGGTKSAITKVAADVFARALGLPGVEG